MSAATDRAKSALDEATKRAQRAGELFSDRGAGAEVSAAYETWMRARAADGDAFAISLGYTADGWSFAAWLAGRSS